MYPDPTTPQAIEVIVERMLPPQPEMAIVQRVTPNGADIQLAYSGRYLRDVPALRGDNLEVGDYVVVMRVKSSEAQWVIIGAASSAYRGRPSGSGTTIVPEPESVVARGRDDHIEVFWPGAKVDSVVSYELQHNTTGSSVGAVNVDLRTNQYDYYADQGTSRYFRVRSVGDGYVRSGWSAWDSAIVEGGAASDFLDLGDTPDSYAGHASEVPIVRPGEDRLIFRALSFLGLTDTGETYAGHASHVAIVPPGETRLALNALAFLSLGDTPAAYTGESGNIVAVHAGEASLEFVAATAIGGANKQVQYNNAGAFGGATGFEWQNASPHVTIQSQNAVNVGLLVKGAAAQSENIIEIRDNAGNLIGLFDHTANLAINSDDTSSLGITFGLKVVSDNIANLGSAAFEKYSNNVSGAAFGFMKARGTQAVPLAANQNDVIGGVAGYAWDGNTFELAAAFRFKVDGPVGSNDTPGRIELETTLDGTRALVTRMTIKNDGFIDIGGGPNPSPIAMLEISSTAAVTPVLIVRGAAAQSASLLQLQTSASAIVFDSGDGLASSVVVFNEQGIDIDFRVEGGTEDNLLRVDAGADEVRLGDWDANYLATDKVGDTWWVGGGGLCYGSLYLHEGAANVDISAVGQGVYVKITGLTTGLIHNVTINSDAFNVGKVGVYKIDWQISGDSQGNNKDYEVDIFVNGVVQDDGSARREFGALGSLGSMSSTAIIDITNTGHDIDIRVKEIGAGAGTDFDIFNMDFNIVMIGGT